MQQFRSLLIKELKSYFRSSLAYFIFFIYLFASVGSAMYFGGYLSIHDTSVFALFLEQPVILILVLPAITMKLWSEEYKSGTAEYLLTRPVEVSKLVMAKFAAAAIFSVVMSLFLLPFVLYTASWLNLDWGAVFTSFCGLWLLLTTFCALGCWVSALNKNLIVSYLLGMFVMAIWVVVPYSYLYQVYNNFLFAEIGVADVWYFLSLNCGFFYLNCAAVEFRRSNQLRRKINFSVFNVLIISGLILLNVVVFNLFKYRADMTAARSFTLKEISQQIVRNIKEPLNIDIYVAKDYVKGSIDYYYYFQQVERFARKYERLSQGMISVNLQMVEAFSELEDRVLNSGLYFEENSKGSRNYFGAIICNSAGNEIVIKQFLIERKMFLEKDIDNALLRMVEPQRVKTIGVYMDPLQNLDVFQGVMLGLENEYKVANVSKHIYEFSPTVDLIVLINPKKLTPYLMYALDQYLMRGGKVAVFFDFYTAQQNQVVNTQDLSLVDFLNKWKIELQITMVDEGKIADKFGRIGQNLVLNKAVPFKVLQDKLKAVPFIENDKGLIGAVLEGKFLSNYTKNIYEGTAMEKDMASFIPFSVKEGKVALISDVDILNDDLWISENSPDLNPYSVIEKNNNWQAVKSLIDYLVGNEIYSQLPVNDRIVNRENIEMLLNAEIYQKYAKEYTAVQDEINGVKLILFEQVGEDAELMNNVLQTSEDGRYVAELEKKLHLFDYRMKSDYIWNVGRMILFNVLLAPLAATIGLLLLLKWAEKRKNAKIKEKFDEQKKCN